MTEDLAATYREWRSRGVRFHGTPRLRRVAYEPAGAGAGSLRSRRRRDDNATAWGGAFARFEDVDRNSFALVSFDEVSRAVEAQRQAAAERQEAERRAAHELEIARQVQARLFPQRLPELRITGYAGACVQTRQVGGDYYDFLDLGQAAAGPRASATSPAKGIAAALLMANLQANLRSQCATAVDQPEQLLRSVNRLFYENTAENAYATLFYSEFDDRTGRLRYANCGHLPAWSLPERRRRSNALDVDGRGARISSTDWDCRTAELQLFAGRSVRDLHRRHHRSVQPTTRSSAKDGWSRRCRRTVRWPQAISWRPSTTRSAASARRNNATT